MLTLREKHRLRVFDSRVLRRILRPKRDKVTGEWRKLYNEVLNDLNSTPNIVWVIKSRRMRWAGHLTLMGEGTTVYGVLLGKPEGKKPLGRPRCGWEDNIKIDVQDVGCGGCGLDPAGSGYGQVAGTCECSNESSGSIKCGEFLD